MSPFYIVLATVAIRLVNIDYGHARHSYIVSIYNKHTGTGRGYQICAGSLITNSYVLTTRYCLPRHAYKIRYGDLKTTEEPTYSNILRRKYHPNSHADVMTNKRMNIKQVVSGSNNIALALVQAVPDQQFGRLTAIDYTSMIGHEVKFCTFDVSSRTSPLRINSKKKRKKDINLKTIFKRKKKLLREYLIWIDQNQTTHQPLSNIRHKLAKSDVVHVLHNVLRFGSGVVTRCQDQNSIGPNMCVVEKCYDFNTEASAKIILTPDFGTPLLHDGRIVGLAADVTEHYLKFTPISPFLNWINGYVNKNSGNVTSNPQIRKIHRI